jgi:hypothetical protein
LLMTNRLMQRAGEDALTHARPRTVWERLPVWPRFVGRIFDPIADANRAT